jgi:hypothetical protein
MDGYLAKKRQKGIGAMVKNQGLPQLSHVTALKAVNLAEQRRTLACN